VQATETFDVKKPEYRECNGEIWIEVKHPIAYQRIFPASQDAKIIFTEAAKVKKEGLPHLVLAATLNSEKKLYKYYVHTKDGIGLLVLSPVDILASQDEWSQRSSDVPDVKLFIDGELNLNKGSKHNDHTRVLLDSTAIKMRGIKATYSKLASVILKSIAQGREVLFFPWKPDDEEGENKDDEFQDLNTRNLYSNLWVRMGNVLESDLEQKVKELYDNDDFDVAVSDIGVAIEEGKEGTDELQEEPGGHQGVIQQLEKVVDWLNESGNRKGKEVEEIEPQMVDLGINKQLLRKIMEDDFSQQKFGDILSEMLNEASRMGSVNEEFRNKIVEQSVLILQQAERSHVKYRLKEEVPIDAAFMKLEQEQAEQQRARQIRQQLTSMRQDESAIDGTKSVDVSNKTSVSTNPQFLENKKEERRLSKERTLRRSGVEQGEQNETLVPEGRRKRGAKAENQLKEYEGEQQQRLKMSTVYSAHQMNSEYHLLLGLPQQQKLEKTSESLYP